VEPRLQLRVEVDEAVRRRRAVEPEEANQRVDGETLGDEREEYRPDDHRDEELV
jgi:hypothetical protein